MTVYIKKPAENLREELNFLRAELGKYTQQQFWYVGDGTETDFSLKVGWVPLHVFNAGLLQKEGSGDDYTVANDGFINTVSFAVAPTNLNDICIIATRK